MPNRLVGETSPYLLQHAHNPVDWYPWGDEALGRAREEDKPILLSIGYSACHWCHVMERESFEDPEIAAIMNEHFISIKVDREERPDLDSLYMSAVQAMTGSGGWPMTVFLTPKGEPFYGGTYFPPVDSRGMPGFTRILLSMAEVYRNRRGDVIQTTQRLVSQLQTSAETQRSLEPLVPEIIHQAFQALAQGFDFDNGGFGMAPKFPQPMVYEFILHYHHLTKSPAALQMVESTLEKMAMGGIYDQVGGGFHRYSTDAHWLVPHFEKMLYDNAQLSSVYLHAYQATSNPIFRRIAEEILDYVLREMTDQSGGFYSTQDADSEGEEGKFFLWTPQEMRGVLGLDDAALLEGYFGVSEAGNFEGRNILNVPQSSVACADEAGVGLEKLEEAIGRGKAGLLEARERRVHPARDDKVLAAWNGLMLRSFAEASSVFGRDDYRQAAVNCASFVLEHLRQNGRLLRSYKDGRARLKGYLEDYAFVADGLLTLYEATFDWRWLDEARSLADNMLDLFWDEGQSAFYDTGKDHETLVVRPRDLFDNATPCGSSAAAYALLRLAVLTGERDYETRAASALRSVQPYLARAPMGMGNWLCALDFYLSVPKEIAIVGDGSDPATRALLDVLYSRYLPNKVVAGKDPGLAATDSNRIPLLEGRAAIDGQPTAHVCQNYVCQLPVTEPDALATQLDG